MAMGMGQKHGSSFVSHGFSSQGWRWPVSDWSGRIRKSPLFLPAGTVTQIFKNVLSLLTSWGSKCLNRQMCTHVPTEWVRITSTMVVSWRSAVRNRKKSKSIDQSCKKGFESEKDLANQWKAKEPRPCVPVQSTHERASVDGPKRTLDADSKRRIRDEE